ncbi:hypothetical protein ACFDTO_27035 [Microbacteriaceae bacterium 4G12]
MFININVINFLVVILFSILFVIPLAAFVRTLLRNGSRKATSFQNIERLLQEQNQLLRELKEEIKQKQ